MKIQSIKQLKDILLQVHEQDEYRLVPYDMNHPNYWIWYLEGGRVKQMYSFLEHLRPEHAKYDIYINGQFIVDNDYIVEQDGNNLLVKFKKANFAGVYDIESDDKIKIKGDIEV
jgi:hypothetical protein